MDWLHADCGSAVAAAVVVADAVEDLCSKPHPPLVCREAVGEERLEAEEAGEES